MPAGSTYTPIATTTLGSNTAQVTFSSISGSYTDLLLVINGGVTTQGPINVQVNSDTASNYSYTRLYGNGTTATSDRFASQPSFDVAFLPNSLDNNSFVHFMNYSNTTTNKTILNRWNSTGFTAAAVGLWRSTAAITSIKLFNASPYDLKQGSTFTLYGIASA
jgi:hypothetical protein